MRGPMKSSSVIAMIVAASFVGCPLLKKLKKQEEEADPAASVADAATVAVTGTGAKNEANVLRYANETPLPNEPAMIGKDDTVARNFPGNGPEVATLKKGTAVAKIAQYFSTGTLVMFDDPSGDGSKLIGWVSPKAFDAAPPPPTKVVVVPPRDAGGTTAPKDAGGPTPTVTDAGAKAATDGGTKPVADAGATPSFPKGLTAYPPIDGKCGDTHALAEGMCRKKCAADADCGRGIKCVLKKGVKVCTSG
jgi:hypothetical protein